MLAQLLENHPEDIQLIFRHFPLLSIHDKASLAGQAAEIAGAQGEFWAMYDLLYSQFDAWTSLSEADFRSWLVDQADEMGLDVEQFSAELGSAAYEAQMQAAFDDALASGITGTPTIFLNDSWFNLTPELSVLEAAVRLTLLETKQEAHYPETVIVPGEPLAATIRLNLGEITIQLYPDSAPIAVNSFVHLAESGWFDNTILHRVIPNVMVEGGDPSTTGFGNAGYFFDDEFDDNLTFDEAGMIALSNYGPNTNGSNFFITLAPLPDLNQTRTIFGRVIDGLDLLTPLGPRDPIDDILSPAEAVIESISIVQP